MPWVFAILMVVLVVAFALVLAGRLPSVPQPTRDRFTTGLPPRPSASDVDQLRLPVVLRRPCVILRSRRGLATSSPKSA